jgi:hypothetical protein
MEVYDAVRPPPRKLEEALGIAKADNRSLEERNQDRDRDEEQGMRRKNELRQQEKEFYDKARRKNDWTVREGDVVWKKRLHFPVRTSKLHRKFANEGVYVVLRVHNNRSVSLGVPGLDGFVAFPKISKRLLAKAEMQEHRQQVPPEIAKIIQSNTALDSDFPKNWEDKRNWFSPGVWERMRMFRLGRLRNRLVRRNGGQRHAAEVQDDQDGQQRVGFRNIPKEQQSRVRQRQQADRVSRAQVRARRV